MAGTLTFAPTEADYVAASRAVLVGSLLSFEGRFLRWTAIMPVLAIASGVLTGQWFRSVAAILLWIVAIAVIQAINFALVPQSVRRMISRRPSLTGEIRFGWSDRGIEAASAAGTSRVDWKQLRRWSQGSHGFVFVVGRKGMLIVPARAIDPARVADLRETLVAHARGG